MKNFKEKVVQFIRDEEGLELSEYAVAGSLIVLGAVAAFTLLGENIRDGINLIASKITTA
ncbi:Flp family type IVb pilin [Marinobacter sp. GN3S48]|uniref:Flp family type IVb pilin n=1 Tax=Marinobacter sp. GN3S48 TaxID=3382302 RepID=UPI00387AD658